MGKLSVIIIDATGNKEQKVGLPDDIKCGIIMVKLIEKIKLPSIGPDGNPISYKFIHKVTGRQLLESQTLAEAGIKDGDVLRLQPEITAGAVCEACGNEEPDGNAFCTKCGKPFAPKAEEAPEATPQAAAPAAAPAVPPVIQNNQANVPYTTVQYQPGYAQAAPVNNAPKKDFFDSIVDKADEFIKIIGILSVLVYFLTSVILDIVSYTSDLYTFILIVQDVGYCGFMLTIVLYIANKIKKDK